MGIFAQIGRVLLSSYFLSGGISQLQQPATYGAIYSQKYKVFYSWFIQFQKLPLEFSPLSFEQHQFEFLLINSVILLIVGMGILFNKKYVRYLGVLNLLICAAIFDNRFAMNQASQIDIYQTVVHLSQELGILGALLLIDSKPSRSVGKKVEKKSTVQQEPQQKEPSKDKKLKKQ